MELLKYLFCGFILILFINNSILCQEIRHLEANKDSIGAHIYALNYTKRSTMIKNNFFSSSKEDGNNFYGLTLSNLLTLKKEIGIKYEANIQIGNIKGNTSLFISITPSLYFGDNSFYMFVGTGPAVLIPFENNAKEYGGFGLTSVMGLNFLFYRNLSFGISVGFEQYNESNFNFISLLMGYTI